MNLSDFIPHAGDFVDIIIILFVSWMLTYVNWMNETSPLDPLLTVLYGAFVIWQGLDISHMIDIAIETQQYHPYSLISSILLMTYFSVRLLSALPNEES